jgi:hypothetical protein
MALRGTIWFYEVRAKPGLFRDRRDAGRRLAERLTAYANRSDVLVLALPRGGVPNGRSWRGANAFTAAVVHRRMSAAAP